MSSSKRFIFFIIFSFWSVLSCGKKIDKIPFEDNLEQDDDDKDTTDNSENNDEDIPPIGPLSTNYEWGQLRIGGGGYVLGIVQHPKDKDIMYIRTDVGGAYKWNPPLEKWDQLFGWIGPGQSNLIGVDGMAIDPNKEERIYFALGKSVSGEGGLYRSEDYGKTWEKLKSAKFDGNGDQRWIGECIAIDPNNSDIIYLGTRTDGLWRSSDDGETWSRISDVPIGYTDASPLGIRSIVFNSEQVENGKSSTIYVGVPKTGIYYSTDNGETFSLLNGSPINPARMQVVNEELFVTHGNGVTKYSDGRWVNITPSQGKNNNYVGLAVDVTNSNKIVVAQRYGAFDNAIFRSSNKGISWEEIKTNEAPATIDYNVPWWPNRWFSSATSSVSLSPDGSGAIFFTDWFGIWRSPDVWASSTYWHPIEDGHEETVVVTLLSPPKGALVYSGMADVFGFANKDFNIAPAKRFYDLNEGFSFAVCEKNPENIAVLGAKSWSGDNTTLAVSSDYGATWVEKTLPSESVLGRISISSTDPNNMVYLSGGSNAYYTTNKGDSWNVCNGLPENIIEKTDIWNKSFPIDADKTNGDFYIFYKGYLYVSRNKGTTWAKTNASPIPGSSRFLNVVTTPGKKGNVWISFGNGGLWNTDNGGTAIRKISDIQESTFFSVGAVPENSNIPAIYCYGKVGGDLGLYRSVDNGNDWVRIDDETEQFLGHVSAIAADRNVFGQIYLGTGGNGIFYGRLKD